MKRWFTHVLKGDVLSRKRSVMFKVLCVNCQQTN
jgi:hypothetical protein